MARKKLGLALGSGAARGFAHLGVLQALEERGIDVDYISGCSIGALLGALYCSGMSVVEIIDLAMDLEPWDWIDISVPKKGLVQGRKLEQLIKRYTGGKRFDQLKKPLTVVATDLCTGERVIFDSGPVYKAVRASVAIPGIIAPLELDGRILADGGLVDPVPVNLVKNMGAEYTVGVNLGSWIEDKKMGNIYDIIIQSIDILQNEILMLKGIDADLIISPYLKDINPVTFNQVEECIHSGRKAALEVMEQLRAGLVPAEKKGWLQSLGRRRNTCR
ncbi:MAG: patatin-like phospholipase family protein [Bacillota bacterium]|nr:patatin-like phospholipase family protein [Bacillota bacterium]MDD3297509.1 patatin-like phospholipase family protein [Bacillota bacterium]MDD3851075.1 patatin-like phospholipase family protein [Bacillota bacterium]MDD4706905.1 patatin-like phospholipase family protein [Bacillota bacterium]